MEVEIGKEALRFENGAFSCYGMPSLIPPLPIGECAREEDQKHLNDYSDYDECDNSERSAANLGKSVRCTSGSVFLY